jgi:protein involved in polysaccharide export with SLBB domain
MRWKSLLIGFATLVALGFGAWASDTREVTEVALPNARTAQADATAAPSPLRPSEGMPRYATMTPPSDDVPAAAPTDKVSVAPAPAMSSQPPPAQPRYASQRAPSNEQVPVAGLRPSDVTLYRLGPGDKVRVTIFNETDLSGDFAIDGQGFVRLPLVGQVPAAGFTTLGLEARIGEVFVNGGYLLNPRISVEIVNYRPFYIIGEVSKPGEYPYVNAMSVPNAIALAGGYTDRAVESTIYVRHQGEAKEHQLRADETTHIRPGDVLRVDRSGYWTVMTLLAPLISPFATTAYILK